jgi:hypothetical protein
VYKAILLASESDMWGGLTDEEQQNLLKMNPSTQRPRRRELQKAGRIRDSRRKRKTASGARAIVWVAT